MLKKTNNQNERRAFVALDTGEDNKTIVSCCLFIFSLAAWDGHT